MASISGYTKSLTTANTRFNPSTIIEYSRSPKYGPRIVRSVGYNVASVIHDPVVSQSPFAQEPVTAGIVDVNGKPLSSSILARAEENRNVTIARSSEVSKLLSDVERLAPTDPLRASELYERAQELMESQDPYTLLHIANDALSTDTEKAGELFKCARKALDEEGRTDSEVYNMAAFGEARYGEVDASTFDALSRVRENAGTDENLRRYETFVRATAYIKTSNEEAADLALLDITQIDSPNDATTVMAWVAKSDLYMGMGFRTAHDARSRRFKTARNILVHEIPRVLEGIVSNATMSTTNLDGLKNLLAEVYSNSASFFLEHSQYMLARDILEVMISKFGNTPVAQGLLKEAEGRFSVLIDNGQLKPIDRISTGDRLKAAALEMFYHMKYPKLGDFWKAAGYGALFGMVVGIIARGGELGFGNNLWDGSWGATLSVLASKGYLGATAPETRQAYKTGYTDKKFSGSLKMGTFEFLKLAGTYAFFGGAIPGIAALQHYTATKYIIAPYTDGIVGHLNGPGSAIAGLFWGLTDNANTLGQLISQHGDVGAGLHAFWEQYRKTVPGMVIEDSIDFWHRNITYAFTDMPKDIFNFLWKTATDWDDPGRNLLRIYKGTAAGYALITMMKPKYREALIRKFGWRLQAVELGLMVGAYMVAADINLMTGVKEWDAWRIPALGVFSQMRLQVMGGNRLDSMNWPAFMRSMIIPTLYTGTGAQMTGRAFAHSESLYDDFKISMWVQIFGFYLISLPHAALVGSNQMEQLKIKGPFGKAWREETVGNLLRLNYKWDSLWGTAFSMGTQIFLQPWINSTWREMSGSSLQRSGHLKKIAVPEYKDQLEDELKWEGLPTDAIEDVDYDPPGSEVPSVANVRVLSVEQKARIEKGFLEGLQKRAKALENSAMQAGARWDYWNFLKGKTWTERMPFILAFYFAWKGKDAPFPTGYQFKYYQKIVFRVLMDSKTPETEVREYLKLLDRIGRDLEPTRRALRHNLLLSTWAARNGPHSDLIKDFFSAKKNGWMLDYYGVSNDKPPESWGLGSGATRWFKKRLKLALGMSDEKPPESLGFGVGRWFKKRLKRSNISADGMIDDDTSLWQRIKGRSAARKGEGKEAAKAG